MPTTSSWDGGQRPRRRPDTTLTTERFSFGWAFLVALPATILVAFPTGDFQAVNVAEHQPAAFASMEGLFETQDGAPLALLGQPDMEKMRLDNPMEVPRILSFLTYRRFNAEVVGLTDIPRDEWPDNVPLHYYAYHIMVGLGTLFIGIMPDRGIPALEAKALRLPGHAMDPHAFRALPVHRQYHGMDDGGAGPATLARVWDSPDRGRILRYRFLREHDLQPSRLHGPIPSLGCPLPLPGWAGGGPWAGWTRESRTSPCAFTSSRRPYPNR